MQKNFANLVKEEIVKRFEALTKEQISDYQELVKTQQASLMSLSNIVNSFKNDFKNVEIGSRNLKEEMIQKLEENRSVIEVSFDCFRRHVESTLKEMTKLASELKNTQCLFSSKDEVDAVKKSSEGLFNKALSLFYEALENANQLNQMVVQRLRKELEDEILQVNQHIELHKKRIEALENKLEIYHIETESYRKEWLVMEKSLFIQEKKIENLYTLIERLQKRIGNVSAGLD